MEAGVTEEDLENALGGRVFPEDGLDLFPDRAKHDGAPPHYGCKRREKVSGDSSSQLQGLVDGGRGEEQIRGGRDG
jgi:hypothetical protein